MHQGKKHGGFWSKLGKGGLAAAPFIAAPFTGGASLGLGAGFGALSGGAKLAALLPRILGPGGAIAGGALAGRAAGRQAEAGLGLDQDKLRFLAAQLNLRAPQMRAANAARGDLLANVQDVSVGAPRGTRLTGGTRPSLLSENSRNLGRQMSRDALLSQMKGDAFTPTALPQSGKFDTLLNILSNVGTGVDAWNKLRRPTAQADTSSMVLDQAPWARVQFGKMPEVLDPTNWRNQQSFLRR